MINKHLHNRAYSNRDILCREVPADGERPEGTARATSGALYVHIAVQNTMIAYIRGLFSWLFGG